MRAGWRAEQTSSAYEVLPDPGASVPPPRCDRQRARETGSFDKSKELPSAPPMPLADSTVAKAALDRRRTVIEARLLMNMAEKAERARTADTLQFMLI